MATRFPLSTPDFFIPRLGAAAGLADVERERGVELVGADRERSGLRSDRRYFLRRRRGGRMPKIAHAAVRTRPAQRRADAASRLLALSPG